MGLFGRESTAVRDRPDGPMAEGVGSVGGGVMFLNAVEEQKWKGRGRQENLAPQHEVCSGVI